MMESEQISGFPIKISPVYFTIIYYVILIFGLIWVNTYPGFKSGPCTPGLDLLLYILLFLGSIILALINFLLMKLRGKKYFPSALIHSGVFIITLIFSLISGYFNW